jgi:hypothetical protein
MTNWIYARSAFWIAIIPFLLIAPAVKGQVLFQQKEFSTSASLIAQQTGNTYRLIRIGSSGVPAILTINHTANAKALPESARNDAAAVRNFAGSEARYIAEKVLSLPAGVILAETGTTKTGSLWLSSYIVSYGGISLRERYLRINIGSKSGEVMLIRNNIPPKQPNSLTPGIAQEIIVSRATEFLGSHSAIRTSPRLIFIDEPKNNFLRLCYEITGSDPDANEIWRLTYDAATGELTEKKSLLKDGSFDQGFTTKNTLVPNAPALNSKPNSLLSGTSGTISAKVHLHNPFDTLTTVGLPYARLKVNGVDIETDSNGFWSAPSVNPPITILTSLSGRYFSILRQDGKPNSVVTSNSVNVLWDDSNSDPAERDAFYSTSFAHLANKRIDTKLTNIDYHMNVNINIDASCFANYSPIDTSLNFSQAGSGCENTGEIADVVFHEYGHRVINARYQQASKGNNDIVDGSLAEGFADLHSAFIRDDPRIGIGFYGDNNNIIRSCDNSKKWPQDISPDIHVSGEIISGAFWDLRKAISHDTAQHLFNFMEYQMPDGTGNTDSASLEDAFASVLSATIITDDDDNNLANGTPHLQQILSAFAAHNITLSNFISITAAKAKDYDTSATSYKIEVTTSYHGLIGEVDDKNVFVFYSADNGITYNRVTLNPIGNGVFAGDIPKMLPGTLVKYYTSATTTLSENNLVFDPSPEKPNIFLVGFRRVLFDDAEQDRGWSLKSVSDQATSGLWVRDTPHGTYTDPTPPINYIRQDTDHTPFPGTMCYLTGNKIDPAGPNDPNFAGYDDVDSGATTLTTPAIVLSGLKSPVIRYWYYYSNDQGRNPGIPVWQTDISGDNGTTWKSLQFTNESTVGWTAFIFRPGDYVSTSSSVVIRFIASEFEQSLVEAGVDDLEVLDPITSESNSVNISAPFSGLPYPNPVHRAEKLHLARGSASPAFLVDLLGRVIATTEGENDLLFIPGNTFPGIYFLRQSGQCSKIIVTE